MTTYQLIISPEAEYDVQNAFQWYNQQAMLGSDFIEEVDKLLAKIEANPLIYTVVN